jgi:hypothetical protein
MGVFQMWAKQSDASKGENFLKIFWIGWFAVLFGPHCAT